MASQFTQDMISVTIVWTSDSLGPRQKGWNFADDIFKWIYLNENLNISIHISLEIIPKGPINNIVKPLI